MAQGQRRYEKEYKVQAVKLAREIGAGKAAKELGVPEDTLYGWQKAVREGRLDAEPREPGPCRGHESGGGVGDAAQAEQGAGAREPAAEGRERVFSGGQRFFRREPSEVSEDLCNDTYGRVRMRQALLLARPEEVRIPNEGTVRREMESCMSRPCSTASTSPSWGWRWTQT